jgi:hypothetical protein
MKSRFRSALVIVAALLSLANVPTSAVSVNARGQVALGVGDGVVSIDGRAVGVGASGGWQTADTICGQMSSTNRLATYDQRTNAWTEIAPRGANTIFAGGGVCAGWLAGFGLFTTTGLHLPHAGLLGVGPDGAVAYVPDRQVGVGATVREQDGSEWRLSDGVVRDLQLLGARRAIWTLNQRVLTMGVPTPLTLARVWRPRYVQFGAHWYVTYWTDLGGARTVMHRETGPKCGWVVTTGDNAFAHDAVALPNVIRIAWSQHEGERPEDLRLRDIDVLTEPCTDLTAGTTPPTNPDPPTKPEPPVDPPKPSQPCGQIPQVAQDAMRKLWALPEVNVLVRGDDDARRKAAVEYMVPQIVFMLGPEWGSKRADPGRPLSKDASARLRNGQLCGWDMVNGTTREMHFGEGEDITGQVFVVIKGEDVLARLTGGTQPPIEPPIEQPDPNVAVLKARIAELETQNQQLAAQRDTAVATATQLATDNDQLRAQIADPCSLVNIEGNRVVRMLFGIGCKAK